MISTGDADVPLVLLSGLNTTSAIWDGVRRHLAAMPEIRTPDLPILEDVDAIAQALLDDLPARFDLCGYSFGGYVAMALLTICPERVRSLLLICSTSDADTDRQMKLRSSLIERLRSGHHAAIVQEQISWMLHPASAARPEVVRTWLEQADLYGAAALIAHLAACMSRPDRGEFLRQTQKPIAVIAADGDALFPQAKQQEFAASIGARVFVTIPDAGHGLPLEQPLPLARAIRDWRQNLAAT